MLIIFDWDGTLCDSTGRIVSAMRQAAVEMSIPVPTEESVRDIIGLGLPEAMARVFPDLPRTSREALTEQYSACYRELDREPSGLFPGVLKVLEELRVRGHLLAVATGKGRAGLERVLGGLGLLDYFDATRCADETRSKPHPLMLRELLHALEAVASECLMVGDSEYDLMMANAVGVAGVGVSYGVHTSSRLLRHRPLTVLDALEDLLALEVLD
jgi:phosphoglycolate phosphatase